MKWQILKQTYLLKEKWLTVRRDHVRMPSGVEMDDYYILEYPTWINVLAITKDKKFILERQYRHGTKSIDFELCAGTCEKGESPLDAAQRELREETGYGGGDWSLYCKSAPNPAAMTNYNYTFIAKGVEKISEAQQEQTEDINVYLVDFVELRRIVENNQIIQGQMAAPVWKYIAENNK
jgi:8-oxo-dGTP pyrophosphatase MutT (NUDIX family)